jgi:hypothetical protein
MRHPIEQTGPRRRCPATGRPFREAWTDHGQPGVYNVCDQCRPGGFVPLARRLAELNRRRRLAAKRSNDVQRT